MNYVFDFIIGILNIAIKLVPVLLFAALAYKLFSKKTTKPNGLKTLDTNYEKVPILTNHELRNYQVLKQYTDENGYTINVKMRLADLINPRKNTTRKIWYRNFMKITSKHVDFTLCDSDMNVVLIIELDDWSHERQDRKDRDQFVDAALTGAGLRILHLYDIDEEGLSKINSILNPIVPKIERTYPTYEEWKASKGDSADPLISPTGWKYNSETKLWDPPENIK